MKNIIVYSGTEEFLIRKELKNISGTIQEPIFNLHRFDDVDNFDSIITSCYQVPLMEDRRVVIVSTDIFKVKGTSALENYLNNPSDSTLLILHTGIDKRSKLYKLLEKKADIKIFNKLKEPQYLKFIKEYLTNQGVSVSDADIRNIAERTSYINVEYVTLHDVVSELDRIIALTGKGDLRQNIGKIRSVFDEDVFKLMHYLGKRDFSKALLYLNGLLSSGTSCMQLLSLMLRHYRILYKLKFATPQEIGILPFQLSEFRDSNYLTDEEIYQCIESILNVQSGIKNGIYSGGAGLEYLIALLKSKCFK